MRSNSRKQIEERAEWFAMIRSAQHIASIFSRMSFRLSERYPQGRTFAYERRIERWNQKPKHRGITGRNHR